MICSQIMDKTIALAKKIPRRPHSLPPNEKEEPWIEI
jgi:hypothetical protein